MKALQKLRLTAADFDVKTVIGRGHFGEVNMTLHFTYPSKLDPTAIILFLLSFTTLYMNVKNISAYDSVSIWWCLSLVPRSPLRFTFMQLG